jgi:hypothetical protein
VTFYELGPLSKASLPQVCHYVTHNLFWVSGLRPDTQNKMLYFDSFFSTRQWLYTVFCGPVARVNAGMRASVIKPRRDGYHIALQKIMHFMLVSTWLLFLWIIFPLNLISVRLILFASHADGLGSSHGLTGLFIEPRLLFDISAYCLGWKLFLKN